MLSIRLIFTGKTPTTVDVVETLARQVRLFAVVEDETSENEKFTVGGDASCGGLPAVIPPRIALKFVLLQLISVIPSKSKILKSKVTGDE